MKLIFFLALLVSASARADFQVVDEKGVLKDLVNWGYRGPEFGAGFACKSTAEYDAPTSSCNLKCTNSYCSAKCDEPGDPKKARLTLTVDDCSDGQVSIFADNGLNVAVTKAEYAANSNSWIAAFLRSISPFISPDGIVDVQFSFPIQIQMVVDGHLKSVSAFAIRGNIAYPKTAQNEGFHLVVSGDLPGVQQIVQFDLEDRTVFMHLRGAIVPEGGP